jgi:hypothetical protein
MRHQSLSASPAELSVGEKEFPSAVEYPLERIPFSWEVNIAEDSILTYHGGCTNFLRSMYV